VACIACHAVEQHYYQLCHIANMQMVQSISDRAIKKLSHRQRLAGCFMQHRLGNGHSSDSATFAAAMCILVMLKYSIRCCVETLLRSICRVHMCTCTTVAQPAVSCVQQHCTYCCCYSYEQAVCVCVSVISVVHCFVALHACAAAACMLRYHLAAAACLLTQCLTALCSATHALMYCL
jgi:hypothetical protein